MTWFRIDDGFAAHPKVMAIPRGAARLRAVGLWTAVGTWCARHLTDGIFAAHIVAEVGGTPADTRHLVSVGLWEPTDGGYRFHDWLDYQPSRAQVEADRAAAAERMRKRRAGKAGSGGSSGEHALNDSRSSRPPSRPVPASAAAAADERGSGGPGEHVPIDDLPVAVEILRTQLQAYTQLAALRFDQLTADQVADLEALVDRYGDGRLVEVAVRTCRNPPPVSVAAFLGTWHALPLPGQRLAVVRGSCAVHDVTLSPSGVCSSCVADQKAGDR